MFVCLFVCLFVLYAFGHGTSKCNEILHRIPFRPGEGYRVVFDPKFSPQGGVYPSYSWIYYCKYLFQEICACDCFSIVFYIYKEECLFLCLFAMHSVPVIAIVTKLSTILP